MTEALIPQVAVFATAAIVVGFASGLFGISGGAILVPLFLTVFPRFGVSEAVVMHSAVGTCLALGVPASIASTRKHHSLGNLEVGFLRGWLPWVALGTLGGALTIELLRTRDLKIIFTVYLFVTALYVALQSASETGTEGGPPTTAKAIGGTVIANLSVWLGLGGGTLTVPYLRFFHYPIRKAIAVSAATGLVITFGGAIGAIVHGAGATGRAPFSLGYVDGVAFLVMTPILMFMAPRGASAATRASEVVLKWIYVGLLFGVAVYMAIRTF
ncbi:MAG: sulfite exporter TauE/SafE family protein [Myxococcota bacterium]